MAETAVKAAPGGTVTLTYTGATVGTNEYISAILADETGAAVYYGRLTQPDAADGTLTVAVPADLPLGSYTLKVFSEQYNGDKKTDFASAFCDVALTTPTQAELDQAAADEVEALITAIGTVEYTAECAAKINAARVAYNALTAAQRNLVTNYDTLTEAELDYAALGDAAALAEAKAEAKAELEGYKNADDYREAEQTELANAIAAGNTAIDNATTADETATALANAKTAIDAIKTDAELTAEEEAAEAAANQAAADAVAEKIDAIGEVTYTDESKAKIDEAKAAFDALTDAQKTFPERHKE